MKVFRIKCDLNKFQSLCFEDDEAWSLEDSYFDCQSRLENWSLPDVYCYTPKHKRGNFFYLFGIPGAFVVDERAKDELLDLLEWSGELLPFSFENEQLYLFNVLECMNVFNEADAECKYFKDSKRIMDIVTYSFYRKRFGEASILKIPQTSTTEILTFTGLDKAPEEMFKTRVEASGLTGLVFQELWDDGVDE